MEVLDLVKRTLPIISTASRSVQTDESTVYSDTKHLHYATVETDHPYKPSAVTHYQVRQCLCTRVPLLIYCWLLVGEVFRECAVDDPGD